MTKKTRIFIVLILVVTALGSAVTAGFRSYISHKGYAFLHQYGFENAIIGHITYYNDGVGFDHIRLDKDGFSTIQAIRMPYPLPLIGKKDGNIIIDDVRLMGNFSMVRGLSVSGWKKSSLAGLLAGHDIILTNARLDLTTTEGSIRLQAKGVTAARADGTTSVNGTIWAVQQQLSFNTVWKGTIAPNGTQHYDININDGRINLDFLSASRMNGDSTFDWTPGNMPVMDGKLAIGKFDPAGIRLSNVALTFKGPFMRQIITLDALVPQKKDMRLNLQLQQMLDQTNVNMTLRAVTNKEMMGVLRNLSDQVNSSTWGVGILIPLMLTKGNLSRVEKEVNAVPHDELELSIYGSLHDLAGKITAIKSKNGTSHRNVISLDPGFTQSQ